MIDNNEFKYYGCVAGYNIKNPSAFHTCGRVRLVLYPNSVGQLQQILDKLNKNGEQYYIVGNSTNTLFKDGYFDSTLISLTALKGVDITGQSIYASAGESLSKVCAEAKNSSLSGLEQMWTIPASVGGGLAMNCGCFGSNICDVVDYVDCLIDNKLCQIKAHDFDFEYRSSLALKSDCIVVGAKFNLTCADICKIDSEMKRAKSKRMATQPTQPSLGSVFKKIDGVSAGYYIDKAGLKGTRRGGAMISDKHANFIVNMGGASCSDFISLAEYTRQQVDKLYKIRLEYEVKILQ